MILGAASERENKRKNREAPGLDNLLIKGTWIRNHLGTHGGVGIGLYINAALRRVDSVKSCPLLVFYRTYVCLR